MKTKPDDNEHHPENKLPRVRPVHGASDAPDPRTRQDGIRPLQRILVIQTAFIGDVILTTPLLRGLKETWPEAAIDVLVTPKTGGLLAGNPHLRQVIAYDKRGTERGLFHLLGLSRRFHQAHYDAAFLPHRSLRTALMAALAGIPLRIGFAAGPASWLYTHTVPYGRDLHESQRYLTLLAPLSARPADPTPQIVVTDHHCQVARDILRQNHLADTPLLVGLAPGSVWPTKRWMPQGFAEVADRLRVEQGAGVIFFGGAEDKALCRDIASRMKVPPLIAAGSLSLLESAALMEQCRVFVSNDTGIMHLAAAMKVPVVAIFGATTPSLGFAPVGQDHTIIERPLPCRPCGAHGGRRCPEKTFACMQDIHPDEVYEAVIRYLKGPHHLPGPFQADRYRPTGE